MKEQKLNQVLKRLENVKSCSRGWTARCPNHNDTNNSLSIGFGDDGRILVHCFAGCSAQQIVAAMGLRMSDLFTSKRRG